jgi:anaphase-promoting complex subunit 5
LLSQLVASIAPDPELTYLLLLLRIKNYAQRGEIQQAFSLLDSSASELKEENGDVYQRAHLLVLKAALFAKAGQPRKGFSVAVRAANMAGRYQIVPILYEALGAVAGIFIDLREFEAARKLMAALLPSVSCSRYGK